MDSWNSRVKHPLQSLEWGQFRQKTGIDVVYFPKNPITAVHNQQSDTQPFLFTIHKLPKLPWYIGYLPKGPAITNDMINFLKHYGKKHKVIFFQIEPNQRVNESTSQRVSESALTHEAMTQVVLSHHPLFTKYTFILDLTKTETELLQAMHPKTRYNMKLAEKHGVVVQEDNSEQAFQEYLRLTEETTKRQGFYAHSPHYHTTMWNTLSPSGMAKLFTATYINTVIAAWIIFVFHDTIYYPYGTSSRDHKNVMAPYLLLWNIAKWGKQHGYNYFDLWGTLGPNPDENDPFYGFHKFKAGFNPQLVKFIGSYDLVIHPWLYKLYCFADTIRWKILKRK